MWGVASETLCDISNMLAKKEEFIPLIRKNPEHSELLQMPILKDDSESIQQALPLQTHIQIEGEIQNDIYVDDLIGI